MSARLAAILAYSAALFLTEGVAEGCGQRTDDVIEGRPMDRRNLHCRGHAGIELYRRELFELLLIDLDDRVVIGLPGALVRQAIGGDIGHITVNHRRYSLLVGRQMYFGVHIGMDIADVFDSDARFD